MKKRVNSGTLAPLLEVARTDPDAAVRHAAFDVATRLTLSEEAWRSVGDALGAAASSLARESPERAGLLALATRVPLKSTRLALRAIAADAGDPACAAVSDALALAGDPSQTGRLPAHAEGLPPAGPADEEPSAPSPQEVDEAFAAVRTGHSVLDDAQMAWVISRTPPSRWIGELVSLLVPPMRAAAERLRVLQIAVLCADHAAERGGSTYRSELIEDEAPAAGAEPPPEASAGPDTLSIPSPGAGQPPTPPEAGLPAPLAAAPASAPAAVPGTVPGDAAVFCPPVVARATAFLVQVFLHEPERAAEARERALEADAAAQRRGVLALPPDLPLGTRIDLNLEMTLQVQEPDAALVWTGRTCAAQFEVTVPATAPLGNTIGRVRLAVAGVPIGTLRFQVAVAADAADTQPARDAGAEVKRYHRAFVSYSSKDRAEVLRRVQAFRIAGISVFQDVLDLEPGQRWEKELYREIDHCDVVLLFWSTAAAASPWVAKEIDYALALKRGEADRPPDIAPVPIEGPPIPPPPERLKHLHFYDALLAHIAVASPTPKP
ncbi:MAG: toll/interleukin-1 receptor domain-containing protein [Rubrivivax sp.]|nr:toll/interleukin-1 receptor domain-containing protein [Rubrivivax sp.]